MPSLAWYHPLVVHFVIALLIVGVVLRWIALTGRVAFAGPAALTLILLGTAASVVAVKSGLDAHGPAERVPGARAAVSEHEEAGEWTRGVFLGVAVLELALLALGGRIVRGRPVGRWLAWAAAVAGLFGLAVLYRAASLGGELVYSYAGGVGIHSGDPEDTERLLKAGLYHRAQAERKAGHPDQAASLVDFAAHRYPGEIEVQLLAAESVLLDRHDPAGALAALARVTVPPDQRPLRLRYGLLTADALLATGHRDAARAQLQSLHAEFPTAPAVDRRLKEIGGG